MRWSRLTGFSLFLIATQAMVACGDDDDNVPGGEAGSGGSTAGTAGKSTAGSAGKGGSGGSGGAFGTSGDAGKGGGGTDGGGMAGTAGTGPTPECEKDLDCADDDNPCTDEVCDTAEGKCTHPNNTADCDDGNECTSADKCADGECKGTNNTDPCDDSSSCTTGEACKDGKCTGTVDTAICPVCAVPGNIIQNCDFTDQLNHWATNIGFDGGAAQMLNVNERGVVNIFALGGAVYSVQPRQEPLTLKQGMKYHFRMLAGSDVDRTITVSLTKAETPYTGYTQGTSEGVGHDFALVKDMKPFEFDFTFYGSVTTEQPIPTGDDMNVKLEIKAGKVAGMDDPAVPHAVYYDDVFLTEVKCTDAAFCDDGNPCTTDACNVEAGTCSWTPLAENAPCTDDNESCTTDACIAGKCEHVKLDDDTECATDDDDCTIDSCKTGVCGHTFDNNVCDCQIDAHCNDNNGCTDDKCNAGTCENTNNTATCDDGNLCTSADVCGGGVCGGTNNTAACTDTDVCTINNMCAAGACNAGTNVCFDCTAGGNLIANCNFTDSLDGWTPGFFGGTGTATNADGRMTINITNGGNEIWMVQPFLPDLVLTEGVEYTVKFNAYASVPRNIIVTLTQNGNPFTSYSGPQTIPLTTEMQLITFKFTMGMAPLEKVKFEFDLGGPDMNPVVPNTVYIDNVFIAPT